MCRRGAPLRSRELFGLPANIFFNFKVRIRLGRRVKEVFEEYASGGGARRVGGPLSGTLQGLGLRTAFFLFAAGGVFEEASGSALGGSVGANDGDALRRA